jgi:hypothetical protein
MSDRSLIGTGKQDLRKRLAAQNLKSCPLCGAINAAGNKECFVCRWAGEFDEDPEVVQIGLDTLIDRCPELAEAFLVEERNGWFRKFLRRIRTFLFGTRIDLQV